MNRSRNGALALIVVLAVLLGRNGLETAGAQATAVADALATGQVIPTGVIPPSKLDDLLTATVGRVRPEMVSKHGNFEAYWKAARSSREGKAFEAIVSDTVNRRNLATGVGRRLYTSASLGFPTSACDLVEVDEAGRVLRRIQLKLGLQGTLDALTDAKYAGMDILTDQDTVLANKAIYDVILGIATLTGNVRITRGQTQLAGDKAEINVNTGISKLLTDPGTLSVPGGTKRKRRVRGLILPSRP